MSSSPIESVEDGLNVASEAETEKHYSIRQLAQEFNITIRALRFYEQYGLLAPKRKGKLRLYSPEDRARLVQIVRGIKLGFTLGEIRALISREGQEGKAVGLHLTGEQCLEQIKQLERRHKDIVGAIAELHRMYGDIYAQQLRESR